MNRPPITKKLRFSVLSRDGFACRYCGAKPPGVKLVIDHLVAVAKGGQSDIANLITACQPCNAGKSDRPLTAHPTVGEIHQQAGVLLSAQEESAKNIRRAMKRNRCARQDVVDFWCSLTGREEADVSTISVMMRYIEDFAAEVVFSWIQKASVKCSYSDRSMGRYVSGIRRHTLAESGVKK